MSEAILAAVQDIRQAVDRIKAKIAILQDDLKAANDEIARLKARPSILQQMQQLKLDPQDVNVLRI
jgi:prefoldin subunit 5